MALLIVSTVAGLALTVGLKAARRAERRAGAWAWIIYVVLGTGMVFGAISITHPLLSAFMWSKLSAFLGTGIWLLAARARRGEALLPLSRRASPEAASGQ